MQAASLLILPMLEAGYDAGEHIVDENSLTTMVNTMFDQQDGASSASLFITFPTSTDFACICKSKSVREDMALACLPIMRGEENTPCRQCSPLCIFACRLSVVSVQRPMVTP